MLGNKVRLLREKIDVSRKELAENLQISYAALAKYETNEREPDLETLHKFADYFEVSIDELLDRKKIGSAPSTFSSLSFKKFPVFDVIGPDVSWDNEKNIVGWKVIVEDFEHEHDFFYLNVQDNSMSGARIIKGDSVLIHRQNHIDNNQIAVVSIGNENAILRRIMSEKGTMVLQPDNPNYRTHLYTLEEVRSLPVRIIGRAVKNAFDL